MKNTLLIILIIYSFSFKSIAQSTTITPAEGIVGQYTNQKIAIQTIPNSYGFEHTNGTVSLTTYVSDNSAWLMTKSNHPLYLSTNNNSNPLNPAMAILTNGNIGIGTSAPTEKLHVIGNARISGLAGSGVKFVRVNEDGVLSSTPQNYNLNLPRGSFKSVTGNLTALNFNTDGLYCLGNTVAYLEAPINLLDGSTITNLNIYFADNSTKNIRVQLFRRAYGATTSDLLGNFSSSGLASSADIKNGSVGINTNNTVDNNAYIYYLRISNTITVNGSEASTVWDGDKITINQIKVTYSY